VILEELSEAFGPSGYEGAVRGRIIEAIQGHVDSYQVDTLGNLIALRRARRRPSPDRQPLKVMVSAHMDEVGVMVTHADKDGLLHFSAVGGLDARVLLAQPVVLGEERLPGVIGMKPIHLQEEGERTKLPKVSDLAIDIGATGKEEAEGLAPKGTYGTFATSFAELGGELRTVKGKAFDDRAGCAVLVELLTSDGPGADYPVDLWAAFTVQEELGLRGARVAAFRVEPDVAFALEGTICDDLPKEKDESLTTELGKGPAITFRDRSVVCDPRLVKHLADVAEAEEIPYQFKQPGLGGTDAGAIHLVKEGVPSAVVAVPSRYIHSPVSLLSLSDLENTVRLMRAALSRLPEGWT
jgi:putative aminopeptidase FrvX